jgi:methionyl-tRNA formyltransferase
VIWAMRIVLIASGEFAIPTLQSLVNRGHDIPCVVTQPDRGSGRGRHSTPTPVKAEAQRLGLETLSTENINEPATMDRLRACEADLGLVIAFGQKIAAPVRALFRHQCINLHASLLPKYRGAAPIQWALLKGEAVVGVTVFRLVDRMDAGPVYLTRCTEVKPDERASELHDRLSRIGVDAVVATIGLLEQDPDFEPTPQDDSQATKAPKLSKSDGHIRFDVPARELADRVCALWSWPGAVCEYVSADTGKSERVTLALARVGDARQATEELGVLDYRLYAATASGYLEVLEIRPESGRVMPFADFVNGRHVKPGDRLAPVAIE